MSNDVDLQQRVADLEAQMLDLALRHSALEWIVEQHFAHYLVDLPAGMAREFLNGISHAPLRAHRMTEEGSMPVRPDDEARLWDHIQHIAQKIGTRVEQGLRAG